MLVKDRFKDIPEDTKVRVMKPKEILFEGLKKDVPEELLQLACSSTVGGWSENHTIYYAVII